MENDPERMDRWYSGSDGTAPAPYMEILDRYPGRTSSLTGSVSGGGTILSLDLAGAEEDGEFLRAQGVISVPVTVTRSQWEALKAGEPVEVTVNELTGQKKILEISDGQTVLYEEGSDRGARTPYIGLSYNYETGLYELWQDSDDTISKPVYEGEILVVSCLWRRGFPGQGICGPGGDDGGRWLLRRLWGKLCGPRRKGPYPGTVFSWRLNGVPARKKGWPEVTEEGKWEFLEMFYGLFLEEPSGA